MSRWADWFTISPEEAAAYLREEEQSRLREIRSIGITSINNIPIRIDDVVVGGPLPYPDAPSLQGVVVGFQTRLGMISQDKALDPYQLTDKSLARLGEDYPGLKPQLDRGVSVSIDGKIYRDAWFQPIPPGSEVFLLPRLAGG